jgi:hypothetical protein
MGSTEVGVHPVLNLQAVGPDAKHLWEFRGTVTAVAQPWLPSCTSSLGSAGSGHHEDQLWCKRSTQTETVRYEMA